MICCRLSSLIVVCGQYFDLNDVLPFTWWWVFIFPSGQEFLLITACCCYPQLRTCSLVTLVTAQALTFVSLHAQE